MKIQTILIPLALSICLAASLSLPSCANTSTPPSGGSKDTIPPVLVRTTPPENSIHFTGKRIELKFDEFPKVTDAVNQIYLSPPQAKRPQAMVRGKSVVVTFPTPLDTNTTYSLHFGQSIVDNNEGNPFGAYSFSFSTGKVIDSLFVTGYVVDAQTLLPLENISLLLHTDGADTTVYKTLPRALAKTDLWGYFTLTNLKGIPYHLFAVEDLNRNYKYEDNNERIAFLDSLLIPQTVMFSDSIINQRINPLDTLAMLARSIERTLYLFKEAAKRQVLRDKVRPQARHFYFTFAAPDAKIHSLQIEGIDSLNLIREHSLFKDTIRYWIRGAQPPDTLKGVVHYLKTDSLNQLSPTEEKFALTLPKETRQEAQGGRRGQLSAQDTTVRTDVLKVTISAKPEQVEQTGILFTFSAYPVELDRDKISLKYTTSRNEEMTVPFTFRKDSIDGCLYRLFPDKWTPAMTYQLSAPEHAFRDIYGYGNDSLFYKITLPETGKAGSISFTLKGGDGFYIVELLSKTRDKTLNSLHLRAGESGFFPYLADDIYVIRITEDKNGNGVWDTGSLDQRIQPERVRFYKFADGSDLIEIKEKFELNQTIELDELFNKDATPIVPGKTANRPGRR